MKTHARLWIGTGGFCVTDMTHAGKVGKVCRTLRFNGYPWDIEHSQHASDSDKAAARWSRTIYYKLYEFAGIECGYQHEIEIPLPFEEVKAALESIVEKAYSDGVSVNAGRLTLYEEPIKGIEAPAPALTAGVEGKWSAGADETGISLRQHDDPNEWSEITHGQTGWSAYKAAIKVWSRVKLAKTLSEAREILRSAGARLHGYCAMD